MIQQKGARQASGDGPTAAAATPISSVSSPPLTVPPNYAALPPLRHRRTCAAQVVARRGGLPLPAPGLATWNDSTSIWGSIWRQRLSACQLHFQAQHLLASSHSFASSTSQLPAHAICLWRRRARTPAPREFISRAPPSRLLGDGSRHQAMPTTGVSPSRRRQRARMDGWMDVLPHVPSR